jgi:glyoxylase-like metal-dependent hydrolase (beta-lactamase superfamily II)
MARASELIHVSAEYTLWHAYDPTVKAELFSTAVRTGQNIIVIDPIPLTAEARLELAAMGDIAAVLLTNANHARAASTFAGAERMIIPAELSTDFPTAQQLRENGGEYGLDALALDGAAPGEFAFHDPREKGTLIIGDALINFEPHGFSLLPSKYCVDRKEMLRSLRRLLDLQFTRIFFAHGFPILIRARERLATVFDECS